MTENFSRYRYTFLLEIINPPAKTLLFTRYHMKALYTYGVLESIRENNRAYKIGILLPQSYTSKICSNYWKIKITPDPHLFIIISDTALCNFKCRRTAVFIDNIEHRARSAQTHTICISGICCIYTQLLYNRQLALPTNNPTKQNIIFFLSYFQKYIQIHHKLPVIAVSDIS